MDGRRRVDHVHDASNGAASAPTFDCLTKIGPFRTIDRMVVTEWEPGRAMGIEHRGLFTGTRPVHAATPVGAAATRFTWTEDIRFPWWLGGRGRRASPPSRCCAGSGRQPAPTRGTRALVAAPRSIPRR